MSSGVAHILTPIESNECFINILMNFMHNLINLNKDHSFDVIEEYTLIALKYVISIVGLISADVLSADRGICHCHIA